MNSVAEIIRERIERLMRDHDLPSDATEFGDDYLLQCAVTELRWCLNLVESGDAGDSR